MKKLLIPIIVIILIIGGGGASYNYFLRGPKITDCVLTKNIDENEKPTAPTTTFTSKDTVYFSAKLSLPEGLEAGHYGVTTYSGGNEIIQSTSEFDVKN